MRTPLVTCSLLVLAACSLAPEPSAGTIQVALVATGAGGVTYRLPDGTGLRLASPTFLDVYSLDGDAPSTTIELPAGDYVPYLQNGAYTATWPLTRTRPDGTSDVVQGTLELPASVTVVEGQTAALVIRFTVAGNGTIVFAQGSLDATVEVDETVASSYLVALDLTGDADEAGIFFAAAPPELSSILPAGGTAFINVALAAETVGGWTWSGTDTACAPAQTTVTSEGGGGLAILVEEAVNTDATICVQALSGSMAGIRVLLDRQGAATSATFLAFGDRSYEFHTEMTATVATSGAVFADGVLHLERLAASWNGPVTVDARVDAGDVGSPDTSKNEWYEGSAGGPGSSSFSGR